MADFCPFCGEEIPAGETISSTCRQMVWNSDRRPEDASAFVGRERELSILGRKLAEAYSGRGGLVILAGEAGIGKTRMIHEFLRLARQRGASVLLGRCFEDDWQPPFGPWLDPLRDCARACELAQLQANLGIALGALAQLVPEIRPQLDSESFVAPLNPDEERFRLYESVTHFLLHAAQDRLVILALDDLHWADNDTLRLLRHVARSVSRASLLIVGAYRKPDSGVNNKHPLYATIADLQREQGYQAITLQGLGYPEVAKFIAEAGGRVLPDDVVQAILDETEGNPFYVREVLRNLAEGGRLFTRDSKGRAGFTPGELGRLEGVKWVVGRRLSRLSKDANTVLRFASGFSGGFTFPVMRQLTGFSEKTLDSCIDGALESGLIRVLNEALGNYDFSHSIVRRTIYEELNPNRKARLHRQIAAALERVYAGRELSHANEIALQYHASARLDGADKGIRYALAAAEQARQTYAFDTAVDFLRKARDLAETGEAAEKAEVLCKLSTAEADAALLEEAALTAQEAVKKLGAVGVEPRAQAEFLATAGGALKDGGARAVTWQPLVEEGLKLVEEEHDLLWARLTLLRERFEPIGTDKLYVGRWLGLDPEAVQIARESGDEDDFARTLVPFDWRTREETESLLELVRTWRRPTAVMKALYVLGRDLLYGQSAYGKAAVLYDELLAAGERHASIPAQVEALCQIAITQIALGELATAWRTIDKAKEITDRLSPEHWLRFTVMGVETALAYFVDGDWFNFAVSFGVAVEDPSTTGSTIGLLAASYAALAQSRVALPEDVSEFIGRLTSVMEKADPTMHLYNVAFTLVSLAVWDLSAAEFADSYRRVGLNLIRSEIGDVVISHELIVARMAALLGNSVEAGEYFARACRKAERTTSERAHWSPDKKVGTETLEREGRRVPCVEGGGGGTKIAGVS